jgi:hypothetical protein
MFESVHDWNYAAAGICTESAYKFRVASCARIGGAMKALSSSLAKKYFRESAFFQGLALTRHCTGAQTRNESSEWRDEQRANSPQTGRTQWGPECQPTNWVREFAGQPS